MVSTYNNQTNQVYEIPDDLAPTLTFKDVINKPDDNQLSLCILWEDAQGGMHLEDVKPFLDRFDKDLKDSKASGEEPDEQLSSAFSAWNLIVE